MHADAVLSPPTATRHSLQVEVRCLSCGVVYEPPLGANPAAPAGCPACGASLWLAATIPVRKASGFANT